CTRRQVRPVEDRRREEIPLGPEPDRSLAASYRLYADAGFLPRVRDGRHPTDRLQPAIYDLDRPARHVVAVFLAMARLEGADELGQRGDMEHVQVDPHLVVLTLVTGLDHPPPAPIHLADAILLQESRAFRHHVVQGGE